MAPRNRLGVNEKDAGAQQFAADDARRYWVSDDAYSPRNADPAVAANKQDYGFNHLNLTVTPFTDDEEPNKPPAFEYLTLEAENAYLALLTTKLMFAKSYILKERELGLSPNRPNMDEEDTAMELAEPPVILDMRAQHLLRLLLDTEAELRRLAAEAQDDELENDERIEGPGGDYLMFWDYLKASLAWQVPGDSEEEKEELAESVMEAALEKIVEA